MKQCAHCGNQFVPHPRYVARAKFCSKRCSGRANVGAMHRANRRPLAECFWEKVDKRGKDECWPWVGGLDARGYGSLGRRDGATTGKAHRISYELNVGAIPAGLCVLHRCDNPPCVNPNHLFVGTNGDNTTDKTLKGRAARKINIKTAKQIFVIQRPTREIAQRFDVSESLVGQIKRGDVWSHVTRGL